MKKSRICSLTGIATLVLSACGSGSSTTANAPIATQLTTTLSYPVVDTGQTKTYNATVEITTPASGASFYGQDAQTSGSQPSFTLSGDGKTVLDNVTLLTWMSSPNTTLATPTYSDKMGITAASAWVTTVNAANYGGYSDWRLPNIKELYSLINFTGTDPSSMTCATTTTTSASTTATCISGLTPFINTSYFKFSYGGDQFNERVIDAQYLSSTSFVASGISFADNSIVKRFGVNFADGRIKGYNTLTSGVENVFYVQLVRGNTSYGTNSFTDNGNLTISDASTGLMWAKNDSGSSMTWQAALAWVQTQNSAKYLGYSDWRLPNVKELETIVDYTNAPDLNSKPAINTTYFNSTAITNENGATDYGYYWASTTHVEYSTTSGAGASNAAYVSFGRALGWLASGSKWIDVHGAGAQRSDPKTTTLSAGATARTVTTNGVTYTGYSFGPQLDAQRGLNYVRLVR